LGDTSQAIRDILDRVSLVQVISEYVPLKKAGRTYKGLCPFHQEKTPSFNVNEERRVFYCFGCHAGGNAVTFLKMAGGMTGREAVTRLAAIAGVELPEEGPADPAAEAAARERTELLHVLQVAQEVFRSNLAGPGGAQARAYLEGRGIGPDLALTFGLGFGGLRHGDLAAELTRRRVALRHAETLGLVSRSKSGGSDVYERFRGRLLFPVYLLDGAIAGFSGRLIPPVEDGPKYLNSPDSVVYQKGDLVFGLHQARQSIRHKDQAILVEGNFDVLSMVAAGFANTVAPMGTALTTAQLRLVRRFSQRVTVMFDGDEAGRKASRRAVPLMIEAGVEGRVALLPAGEDPDTFARRERPDAVAEVVGHARPMVTHLVEALLQQHGRTPHGLRRVVEEAKEAFAADSDPFRYGQYREELARLLGVDVREVRKMLRDPEAVERGGSAASSCPAAERTLVELLLAHPRLIDRFLTIGNPSWVTHPEAREILGTLLTASMTAAMEPAEALIAATDVGGGLRQQVIQVLSTPDKYAAETAEENLDWTLADLEEAALKRDMARLQLEVDRLAGSGGDEIERLALDQLDLGRRVREIAKKRASARFGVRPA
jgi:DNA primase